VTGERLPLLRPYRAGAALLHDGATAVSRAQFAGTAAAIAAALPASPHAINLCESRASFLYAFAAVALRGQASLLPPSRAPGVVEQVARAYPGSYLICDGPFEDLGLPVHRLDTLPRVAPWNGAVPTIAAAQTAAIAFTSGSTGGPQPHVKSWRNLFETAGLCAQRFLGTVESAPAASIVATVPPQHMFGLELSVMMPLAGGCSVHAGRPFFPEDVRAALAQVPEPRVLVTTPVHLKSLAASGLAFPPIAFVVSATAPLPREDAQRAERALGTRVHEIYGCTEAGSMCTRRTVDGDRWQPYPGLRLHHHEGVTHVTGAHLDAPAATPDVVESHDDGTITLLGRAADMVKVAGKRASLAELTGKLLGVPGVEDGVMFMPSPEGAHARPAALVVAPALSESDILDALAREMDPVFLPRPLRKVDRLPRNALGKLPRGELLALLERP